ncbi:MAG: dihydrolipoamide acyltransferase [Acidobacteria bacterium]|nr:dihydrolipoamide acyltransferase [Acidobacteriota bacterium]
MSVTVRMPQLGETVIEGTILRWAKQPGESIAEDEVLLEVSTDKVDTEVPSPTAGVLLEILVAAGETVPVGTPLALIGVAGEMPAAPPAAPAVAAAPVVAEAPAAVPVPPAPEPVAQPAGVEASTFPAGGNGETSPSDLGFLSPVVRRLAAEHGLDLRQVAGTGREGRVTRKDVQGFIDAQVQGAPMAASVAPEMPVVEILPATPVYAAPAAPVAAAPVVAAPPPAVVAVAPPAAPVAAPPVAAPPPAVPVAAPPPAVPAKRVGLGRGIGPRRPPSSRPPRPGRRRRPRRRSRCGKAIGWRRPAACGCASPSGWWPAAAPPPTSGPWWRWTTRQWSRCAAGCRRGSGSARASP